METANNEEYHNSGGTGKIPCRFIYAPLTFFKVIDSLFFYLRKLYWGGGKELVGLD